MENQKMSEQNCYGDGIVFEGVRSNDSVIPTLQLAIDLEGPHGIITCQQAASELRRLHEVNQDLLDACIKTIEENLHLADGDVCTLIQLKKAIAREWNSACADVEPEDSDE